MLAVKGISLSIRAVVLLLIAIVVLLAILLFFGGVWDVSPFEHAMGNVTEQQPEEEDFDVSSVTRTNSKTKGRVTLLLRFILTQPRKTYQASFF